MKWSNCIELLLTLIKTNFEVKSLKLKGSEFFISDNDGRSLIWRVDRYHKLSSDNTDQCFSIPSLPRNDNNLILIPSIKFVKYGSKRKCHLQVDIFLLLSAISQFPWPGIYRDRVKILLELSAWLYFMI